ncbi:MAG: flavodoxin [Lachnospiraceae bacterium]|nr:flavodoxin [Lachnospiraceae bacterium]
MGKVLVAYFSASNVTANVAERLAKEIGADLFEIRPEVPYTAADLDWMDKKSRSSVEMNDRSCRPAIGPKVQDMSQYAVLFIGFPIWWYREPSIIDTFLEAYDLDGKTVVPFATSGGSPMGDTAKNMQALVPGAKVAAGKRVAADISGNALAAWAAEWI